MDAWQDVLDFFAAFAALVRLITAGIFAGVNDVLSVFALLSGLLSRLSVEMSTT